MKNGNEIREFLEWFAGQQIPVKGAQSPVAASIDHDKVGELVSDYLKTRERRTRILAALAPLCRFDELHFHALTWSLQQLGLTESSWETPE